ncbi:hypothetical protein WJX72_000228 [[Myrmecia] bisecta]|uniref:Uncharacterized protein n=1 Tax=[Myrmecia] bisecta TaxID=41462 RepID=A0AAW1QNW0_9CHLO
MTAPDCHAAQPILRGMGHKVALERERAAVKLDQLLSADDSKADVTLQQQLAGAVRDMLDGEDWETRLGALQTAQAMLRHGATDKFGDFILESCQSRLEDEEVRVRLAVGACLRTLAERRGVAVYEACSQRILASIEAHFDRDALVQQEAPEQPTTSSIIAGDFVSDLLQSSYKIVRPGSGEMRHGTEGWKCLETSYRALQQVMEGCGPAFKPHVILELRSLLYRSLLHPNRFVRETGYHILASVCRLCKGDELHAFGQEVANRLQDGLSENWSQVRYAACVATRAFMEAAEGFREEYFPIILPHMCLNRYDVAEGVRSYSQDTWRLIMGQEGRHWVARCAPQVVAYYTLQSKTNNYCVREAACNCMAELATKIDKAAVQPFLPRIMRALISCFRDDSWPVRDAACIATAKCVLAYPEEARQWLEELYPLWLEHLDDNIFSVRENAAIALGDVVRAYQQEALDRLLPVLREMLPRAKEQPPGEPPSMVIPVEPTTDPASTGAELAPEEDKQSMFYKGAVTARKREGSIDYSCGCMDYGIRRAKEPWEASDGAIYLLRELAEAAPQHVPEFLPVFAEVVRLDHYAHCRQLQETAWKQLPKIAKSLGKRSQATAWMQLPRIAESVGKQVIKPHLELFIPALFQCLTCGHQLCQAAAGRCLGELRDLLGPRIFAGRLTDEQNAAMAASPDVPPPSGCYAGAVPSPAAMQYTSIPSARILHIHLESASILQATHGDRVRTSLTRTMKAQFVVLLAAALCIAAPAHGYRHLLQSMPTLGAAPTDTDILNFALQLECLEGQFYSYAAFGQGLNATDRGNGPQALGGKKANLTAEVQAIANEIATDEINHVRFLRAALGANATACPAIDIFSAFTNAASAAFGVANLSPVFDVYANDINFLLGAYIFEDVGVTAYKGAAPLISNPAYLGAAAGIMAVEAYHAATVRTLLLGAANIVTPYGVNVTDVVSAISALRNKVGGAGLDEGIIVDDYVNLVPADANSIAFSRTPAQVLDIVYLGNASTPGGFFPNGIQRQSTSAI